MSSSITSPEVISSQVTSYAWTGGANASGSVERVNGAETRRNLLPNPPAATNLDYWVQRTNVEISRGALDPRIGTAAVRMKTLADDSSVLYLGGQGASTKRAPVTAGRTLPSSIRLTSDSANTVTVTARIVYDFYGASGYVGVAYGTPASIAVGGSVVLTGSVTVPSGANTAEMYIEAAAPGSTGFVGYLSQPMLDAEGTYFDGATAGGTISSTAVAMPLLVDGYQSTRQSRHVFNNVIGRAYPDVTLLPAAPRRGTLRLLFATEEEAASCERMHLGVNVLTFADSELPSVGMTYVVDGAITRQLDPETLLLWLVSIDYQEVTA